MDKQTKKKDNQMFSEKDFAGFSNDLNIKESLK